MHDPIKVQTTPRIIKNANINSQNFKWTFLSRPEKHSSQFPEQLASPLFAFW